ncbi:DegT/DnrJ/EryC1/StrS family aminotransferase, partial [bacterium]|nr:DegT/DnrJ/EryC1/StrS family aminotransferase [bacterium]
MTVNNVPLLDLNAQYEPMKDDIIQTMTEVFNSKRFINGPKVDELETKMADYCGAKYAIAVSSGTDALIVSLMALEIGAGDEVITTPFTFFATAGCIARVGAKPVFVDIDPETFNIDSKQIEAKITPKTKAIMPVHLFGQMADMDPILSIAQKHNLYVIEDAAQAIGSTYYSHNLKVEKKAGSMGTIGCFSFFPSKNLGACGDAGAVTTNDEALAKKIKALRMHGESQRYYH